MGATWRSLHTGSPRKTLFRERISSERFDERGCSRRTPRRIRTERLNAMTDKRKTSDAGETLDRITGNDPKLRKMIAELRLNVRVAEMIYQAREAAGLTQAELAELVGTSQSVISRLEDADYDGHSLSMLQRLASALHQRVEVTFIPEQTS